MLSGNLLSQEPVVSDQAEEAQKARFGGKIVWQSIRDMQHCRRGLVPSRSVIINDEEGNPCTTPLAQQQHWKRHFTIVLNLQSELDEEELEQVRQQPMGEDLARKPSTREQKRR